MAKPTKEQLGELFVSVLVPFVAFGTMFAGYYYDNGLSGFVLAVKK